MAPSLRQLAANIVLGGALAGTGYTLFAIGRVRAFRKRAAPSPQALPPITIFKPLHGLEPHLEENLRSFCDQDYPRFQIVFTAADANDPALEVARHLQRRFADRDIVLAGGAAHDTPNPKIGNIMSGYDRAAHDILVIADSDIRVGPGYLRAIAASFADLQTGAATCLYGARSDRSLASELGAMHVNDFFAPSVLVAQTLEPLTYCFGASMAVRREVLEKAGGLCALGQHLGDDYLLGRLVVQAGYRVELCAHVVQTNASDPDLRALWRHELRWARTILAARPAGFAGSVLTYALPLSLVYAILAASPFGGTLAALAAALRTILHYESRATFAPKGRATPWLIPLRDSLSLGVWTASFFGRSVRWRSNDYQVEAGGRMATEPNKV